MHSICHRSLLVMYLQMCTQINYSPLSSCWTLLDNDDQHDIIVKKSIFHCINRPPFFASSFSIDSGRRLALPVTGKWLSAIGRQSYEPSCPLYKMQCKYLECSLLYQFNITRNSFTHSRPGFFFTTHHRHLSTCNVM